MLNPVLQALDREPCISGYDNESREILPLLIYPS